MKPEMKFGVSVCSVCEQVRLSVGSHKHGGIRYCEECIKHTLGWIQVGEAGQKNLIKYFDMLGKVPTIKKLIEKKSKDISPELAKDIAYGESVKRLVESEAQ